MAVPQGVWSLKEALERREQDELKKQSRTRSKRRKVIEVVDDEIDRSPKRAVTRNNTVEPVTDTVLSPTTSAKEAAKARTAKTRKPPKKKPRPVGEENGSEDAPTNRPLPRETPTRKSPRIKEKAIRVSDTDDSEPELLGPNRKPLSATENITAEKKTRAPPKSNSAPPEFTSPSSSAGGEKRMSERRRKVRESTYFTPPSALKSDTVTTIEDGELVVKGRGGREIFLTPPAALNLDKSGESTSDELITTKNPRSRSSAKTKSAAKPVDKPPEKRKRRVPPAPTTSEPILIPDRMNTGKRKGAITSKVVKIKKPAPKKGPAKAGTVPPLKVGTLITNSTQKTSYKLEKVLGSGGFGFIYVVSEVSGNVKAVMKVEPQDNGPLFSEMHFYQRAGKLEQIQTWCSSHKLKYLGIPEMLGFGIHMENKVKFRYLVMPLFEGDLVKKHESCDKKFSIQTTLLLCIRMMEALHYTHEAGYVHADIKSANILLKNKSKEVYLADFGLAAKYTFDGVHKQYKEEPAKAHNGTKEFTSIDAHKGVQPSRRGDLQILGYCAIEWLGGNLPWYEWDNNTNIRSEKIKYEKKSSDLLEDSLGLANLSSKPWKALKSYLSYAFNLGYEDSPNYSEIIGILRTGLAKSDTGFMTWN